MGMEEDHMGRTTYGEDHMGRRSHGEDHMGRTRWGGPHGETWLTHIQELFGIKLGLLGISNCLFCVAWGRLVLCEHAADN